jgi:hypothetical protein
VRFGGCLHPSTRLISWRSDAVLRETAGAPPARFCRDISSAYIGSTARPLLASMLIEGYRLSPSTLVTFQSAQPIKFSRRYVHKRISYELLTCGVLLRFTPVHGQLARQRRL